MNPGSLQEAREMCRATIAQAEKYTQVKTVVCPPFTYLKECTELLRGNILALGAQDAFWEDKGAYTGEISISMLKECEVEYVLVGHSDRRYIIGETDEMINKKVSALLGHGMHAVLLVGEREKGDVREDILIDQLSRDLHDIPADQLDLLSVGYEPVWAISTSRDASADTPENTLQALAIIKSILKRLYPEKGESIPLLYGGSVNEKNAESFLQHTEILGAVIGGASLRPEELGRIITIASQCS